MPRGLAASPSGQPPRKRAWRPKYALELGLRPVEFDPATREVLTVECVFCTAFGREPPPTAAASLGHENDDSEDEADGERGDGDSSEASQRPRKKPRARTSNVRRYKHPFRPDNIRLHMRGQHPARWAAFRQLVARAKQDGSYHAALPTASLLFAADSEQGDAVVATGAVALLREFFGALPDVSSLLPDVAVMEITGERAQAATPVQTVTAIEGNRAMQRSETAVPLLVTTVTVPEIVTELLENFVCLSSDQVCPLNEGDERHVLQGAKRPRSVNDVEGDRVGSGYATIVSTAGAPGRMGINVPNMAELARTQQLLALGLSFEQAAQVLALDVKPVDGEAAAKLTSARIASYARASIASSLQMLSDLMRRAWTYTITLDVSSTRRRVKSVGDEDKYRAIDVRVHLPSPLSSDVLDAHLVALPLLPFEHHTLPYVTRFLDLMDGAWRQKLLGTCINGAAIDMGVQANLLDRIADDADSPFYHVWRPVQHLTEALRRSLDELTGAIIVNGIRVDVGFVRSLRSVTTFLRGQEAWMCVHGRCPIYDPNCPWSMLRTVKWLVSRRDAISEKYAGATQISSTVYPGPIFWLVALVVIDVLSTFEATLQVLESFPSPTSAKCRCTLGQTMVAFSDKCGITRSADAPRSGPNGELPQFEFGENISQLGGFAWKRDRELIGYIRSLNLSSRRLYADMSSTNQGRAEYVITCFILRALHTVGATIACTAHNAPDSHSPVTLSGISKPIKDAPPTLPLDFVALDRNDAVDLIELHSARLEAAFDLRFMDAISCDMETLRAVVNKDAAFRLELEKAQAKSFNCAWSRVKNVEALRVFASGLATVLPRATALSVPESLSARTDLWFPVSDEDQFRTYFTDVSIEARLHTVQAESVRQEHAAVIEAQADNIVV